MNYVAASVVGAILIAENLRSHGAAWFQPAESVRWAVLLGLAAGAVFFLGFLFYQLSVRRHGVGLAGAFAKVGILIPMALSLVLWREMPKALQWCGIGLAVFSILLVNWPGRGQLKGALKPALLLLLLCGGLSEFSNKVFERHGLVTHKSIFLATTFSVALLCSFAGLALSRRPITRRDVLTGFAVGVPNIFSSFFLISALSQLPAAVVFPAYGAGTIVIIVVAGALIFGERLGPREKVATALIVVALVLINL